MCCKHIRIFIEKLAVSGRGSRKRDIFINTRRGLRLHSTRQNDYIVQVNVLECCQPFSIREGSTDMFQENVMDKYAQKVHFLPFSTATTLVKFRKISSTQSCGPVLSSYRKWPILCKMQMFQFFTASPLKIRACGIERKCVEYN